MMKEKVRSTKLKGTVLYTVISVLMVLIVFLMGTLALAATASNRAMNNYNSAQTQYTAKAGVQAIMSAMQNNKDIAKEIANVDADYPLVNVDVDFGITDETTGENPAASLGRITSATAEFAGTKWVLNTDTEDENYGKMEEKVVVKISATAQQGRESSTVSAYVLRDAEPKENSAGGGGGFVSTGSASNVNHTSAFGGTYVGFDGAGVGSDMSITNPATFESDLQINGNLHVATAMDLVFKEPGTGMTIWGDLNINNGGIYVSTVNADAAEFENKALTQAYPYTDIPYIYVEGKFSSVASTPMKIGSKDVPLNIFCGSITTANSTNSIYADIYCYDESATSVLQGHNASQLYEWVAKVIDSDNVPGDHYGGSFYTKGSLEIVNGSKIIDGEMFVGKNLTIKKDTVIYGDLFVGGTLTIDNANLRLIGGTVHCNAENIVQNGGSIVAIREGVVIEAAHEELKPGITPQPYNDAVPGMVTDEYGNVAWYWCRPDMTILPDMRIYDPSDMTGFTLVNEDGKRFYQKDMGGWTKKVEAPQYTLYYDDATGAEVTKDEAYQDVPTLYYDEAGNLLLNAEGLPATEADVMVVPPTEPFGDAKFPAEYEKDVILGNAILPGHENNSSTKIITTVADVMASAVNPYNTLFEVPDTWENDVTTNKFALGGEVPTEKTGFITYNSSTKTYTVKKSCTLSGSLNGQKVIFQVKKGEEIWVQIDGLTGSNESQLILDDVSLDEDGNPYEGTLNILVNGDITFSGNNGTTFPLVERSIQSLMESGEEFQIYTSSSHAKPGVNTIDAININLYCAKNGGNGYTFKVKNATMVTANITAPYLDLRYESNTYSFNNTIWYNEYEVKNGTETSSAEVYNKVGCFGCCVIKTFGSDEGQCDNFMLLYVPKDTGTPDDGDWEDALMTSWRILYYENY